MIYFGFVPRCASPAVVLMPAAQLPRITHQWWCEWAELLRQRLRAAAARAQRHGNGGSSDGGGGDRDDGGSAATVEGQR